MNKDDILLLATDGLTGCVEKEDIKDILSSDMSIEDMSKNLN